MSTRINGDTIRHLRKQRGWSQAELAKQITRRGWKCAQGNIQQLESGAVDLPRYLRQLADVLNVRIDALFLPPERAIQTSSAVLEEPAGYANASAGIPVRGSLPVLTWVQAGRPHTIDTDQRDNADHEQMLINRKYPPGSYALRVRGDSMVAPDGAGFPDGSHIAIDPHAPPQHGDYVVARFAGTDEATFKQLIIDGPHRYLKPLNPRYPTLELTADATLCGVVKELVYHRRF